MEKLPDNENNGADHSVNFIRHSKSGYKTYGSILGSDNPHAPFNPEEQTTPDLTGAGIELARVEAENFFATINPETTSLFFASSNEARAIETANIYREIAKEKGFEILVPENPRSSLAEELGEGEIRVVHGLSINPTNLVIDNIFQTPSKRNAVNWEMVDPEVKRKFEEASKIIEADDQGNFGPNFAKHSEVIKEIFPEIETSEELYEKQFRNIIRLIKFGIKKAEESGMDKQLKIVAFGHENYLVYALEKFFEEEGINNCEVLEVGIENGNVVGEYRGKKENIE